MNNRGDIFSVLIPDGEHVSVFDIASCFSEKKGIKIFLMSNKKNIPIKYSKLVHLVSYYPESADELEWISNINTELAKYNIDLVMPIHENGFKTIVKYKNLISVKKLCILPDYKNFNIANNKELLSRHMFNNHIASPRSIAVKSGNEYKNNAIRFPVLAKPTEGFGGGDGIFKFSDEAEIKLFFNEKKFDYDYLIEEYIEGYDLCCNVLCLNGNINVFTIQKGTLWGNKKYGVQIGQIFLHEKEVYNIVEKLMKSLNWSGVANIDLRYDKKDGVFKILEINPRFWSSLLGSLVAGVNFPYLYALLSLNINFKPPIYNHVEYLNLEGLKKSIKNNILFVFRFRFILKNTYFKFILRNPFYGIYLFLFSVINFLKYKLNL